MKIQGAGLLPEALVVDYLVIDAQHEAIFAYIETLKEAYFRNNYLPIDELERLLNSLEKHFTTEEEIAAEAGVDFLEHIRVHRDDLKAVKIALDSVRSGASDAYSFLRYVELWFERHIILHDKPVAAGLQLGNRSVDAGKPFIRFD